MHPQSGSINLNPRLDRDELPPIEFDGGDPNHIAAGRAMLDKLRKERETDRAEKWNAVST